MNTDTQPGSSFIAKPLITNMRIKVEYCCVTLIIMIFGSLLLAYTHDGSLNKPSDIFAKTINPSEHSIEYENWGYDPRYCAAGHPSFDQFGRPYIIIDYPFTTGEDRKRFSRLRPYNLMFLRSDGWHFRDLRQIIRDYFMDEGDIVQYSKQFEFTADTDEMFLLIQYRKTNGVFALILLTSNDRGNSFSVNCIDEDYEKPFNRIATEHFSGHNVIQWPILVAMSRRGNEPVNPRKRMRDYPGKLFYLMLGKVAGKVTVVEKGVLSDRSSRNPIGSFYVTAQIVSTKDNTHIVWHDTKVGVQRGDNRTYIRTYNRSRRCWSSPTYIGPATDDHGYPTVVLDSRMYIHVLCGTHGSQVYYTRSLRPDDSSAFQPLEVVPGAEKATHLSFICDKKDRLHLFFRDSSLKGWMKKGLSYVSRDEAWGKTRRLANCPVIGYCRMLNHVSMDKQGRLFLNYGYYTLEPWGTRAESSMYYPVLAYSEDRGKEWALVPDNFFERFRDDTAS